MKKILILLAIYEITYFAVSRTFLATYSGGAISKELIWTGIRIVSLLAVVLTFRKTIFRSVSYSNKIQKRTILGIGILFFLCVPVFIGNWNPGYPLSWVYAATSIVIGLREEFVYRGVLQNVLCERFGLFWALVISNLIFVFYHYGSMPLTSWNIFHFFVAGSILGLIYHQSQNIWLAAAVHTFYDVIWSLSPVLKNPAPVWVGSVLLIVSIITLLHNFKRTKLQQAGI